MVSLHVLIYCIDLSYALRALTEMPSASLYIMVSLHVLIKKYAAVVKATSRSGHSRDSGNFQQIFDAKVFNKFFHPNFREKFSGKIFNQIFGRNFQSNFREKFSIKFFVGLDRDAGSSKLARFGIVRGCAARDRSRRLLRHTISSRGNCFRHLCPHNRHTGCLATAQFILLTPLIKCPGHEASS